MECLNKYIEFPDKVFERYLLDNFDHDRDGRISVDDAGKVESMQIDGQIAPHITSLQGIEHFVNLRELTVQHTNICTLDVSRNVNLERLNCKANRLQRLNLGRLAKLQRLYCDNNRLERLDISGLPSLKFLHCAHNRLTKLDLTNKRQLIVLLCGDNRLTELDVSGLPLMFLECENNLLAELCLFGNRNLINIRFSGNPIERMGLPCYYDFSVKEIICDIGDLDAVIQHYPHLWDKAELDKVPPSKSQQERLFIDGDTAIKVDFTPARAEMQQLKQ